MRNVCLYFQFGVILLSILNFSLTASNGKGPFRTSIVRSEKCAKPSRPYEKVPTAVFYAELYNTTKKRNLMRGKATVLRDNKNLVIRFKGFYWVDGKWQLSYFYNNVGCNSMLLPAFLRVIGLKYDKKNCSVPKGTYTFEDMDYNEFDHLWVSRREYGKMFWITEAHFKVVTVVCWEIEAVVSPLQGQGSNSTPFQI